jgi:diguanylate cyclase (GGDEF)-like protein
VSKIVLRPHHVARLGGNELAIIFNSVTSVESLHASIDQIVAAIGSSIETYDTQVAVTASIGIAIGPEDASDPDASLRNADIALYSAKKDGGNTQRFFAAQMLIDFNARHANGERSSARPRERRTAALLSTACRSFR